MSRGTAARRRRSATRAAQRGLNKAHALTAGASGGDYPLSDRERAWDASAANGRWRSNTGSTDKPSGNYKSGFMWYDASKPDDFGSYKLPFVDVIDGKPTAIWRGVTAVAGALQGARGGVAIPDSDKGAVRSKVEGYYAKARKAFNDPSLKPPWQGNAEASAREVVYALAYAECGNTPELVGRAAFWADQFAAKMCAACGHSSTMHMGAGGMCTYEDADGMACDCKKMTMSGARLWWAGDWSTATSTSTSFDLVPVEHQPRDIRPRKNVSPKAPDVDPNRTNASQVRWDAVLCPEGEITDDGRMFAPESISWRQLPLSLMVMTETADGHDGAWLGGRIDRIWRDGMSIRAEGIFVEDDEGQRAAKLVADGALTGVSVDIAVREYEIVNKDDLVDGEGKISWPPKETEVAAEQEEPDLIDILFGDSDEKQVLVVTDGVIGAVTVCPFPAFSDAHISLTASGHKWNVKSQAGFRLFVQDIQVHPTEEQSLTAAAAGLAPVVPPVEWFENPELSELTPLSVTPEGRVFGHAADWETCHIGIPGACTTAPQSHTEYALFHLGAVLTDAGTEVPIGKITLGTGHAAKHLGWQDAAAHYDNTGTAVADVVTGEDEHGIWVAGALRPDISAEKVRELRAAVLSGDWREFNGALELVALLAVNVPGFPIPRKRALVATGEDWSEVVSLVAAGITTGLPREPAAFTEDDMARLRELAGRARRKPVDRAPFAKLAEAARRPFEADGYTVKIRELATRAKTETFYSDDQPRDDHGRWAGAESGEAMAGNPPGQAGPPGSEKPGPFVQGLPVPKSSQSANSGEALGIPAEHQPQDTHPVESTLPPEHEPRDEPHMIPGGPGIPPMVVYSSGDAEDPFADSLRKLAARARSESGYAEGVETFYSEDQPRDDHGRWGPGGGGSDGGPPSEDRAGAGYVEGILLNESTKGEAAGNDRAMNEIVQNVAREVGYEGHYAEAVRHTDTPGAMAWDVQGSGEVEVPVFGVVSYDGGKWVGEGYENGTTKEFDSPSNAVEHVLSA